MPSGDAEPAVRGPAPADERVRLAGLPLWAWGVAVAAVLLMSWIALPWRGPVTAVLSFFPAAAVLLGIRVYRPDRAGAWRLFAAGLGLQFLGGAALALVGRPPSDPAIPVPPATVAAVLLLPAGTLIQLLGAFRIVRTGQSFDRWAGIDTAVIVAALGFTVWFVVFDPVIDAGAATSVPVPFLAVILLIDLLFLELGVELLSAAEIRRASVWLFLGSTGCALASQVAFTAQVLHGAYAFGGLTDLGWQAANAGWGVMALLPSMAALVGSAPVARSTLIRLPRFLIMAVAALAVPLILVIASLVPGQRWDGHHLLLAGAGSGVVMGLVILRTAGAMTELHRQQATLQRSEERYRTLVEESSDAILLIDRQGRIVEANAAASTLLGRRQEELQGGRWDEFLATADATADQRQLEGLPTGVPLLVERRLRRGDGASLAVELSSKRLTTGQVLHVVRDISDRKRGEAERTRLLDSLRASERDLAEAQRLARLGSWTLDPASGRAAWSPEMYRLLGLDPHAEPVGLADISRLFTRDGVRLVTAAIERAVSNGESWSLDLERAGTDDGGGGWVESHGVPERDATGAVTRVRGTMQDVTAQRRLEADLRQSQRLEGVGQLAGGIAHDFNNILTAIRGYAELVGRDLAAEDRSRDDIDQVILAADRAAELTRQLLAFSRRQVLQPRVLDPARVVTEIAPMLRRLLGEHVELVTHAVADLGRTMVDPSQLQQIILNLVVNARDAMPGGGTITIETINVELDAAYVAAHAEARPGAHVALIVTDTGSGMDRETRRRIFEPFFTTKDPGQGTGMGLATVYGIVKQSGGSIYVYSEPGHGTSFKIYLPRIDDDIAADAIGEPSAAGAEDGSETVLLVEDEVAVGTLAARVLIGHGYTVLRAANGAEALAVAAAHVDPIHLLATDVIMPGMQGHQLAEQLTAHRRDLRVLYISGFTENSVILRGVAREGVNFLPKPFTAEALVRAVRRALDREQAG